MLMTEPEPPPDGADTAAGDTSNDVHATWVAVTADALLPDGWVVREKTSKDGKRKSKSYRFGATGKIHASLRSAKDAAAGLEAGPAINAIDGAAVADPVPDDGDAPAKKRRKAAAAAAAAAATSSDAPQRPPEQPQLARAAAAATSTAAVEADRTRALAQVTMSHVADNPPSLNRAHHSLRGSSADPPRRAREASLRASDLTLTAPVALLGSGRGARRRLGGAGVATQLVFAPPLRAKARPTAFVLEARALAW